MEKTSKINGLSTKSLKFESLLDYLEWHKDLKIQKISILIKKIEEEIQEDELREAYYNALGIKSKKDLSAYRSFMRQSHELQNEFIKRDWNLKALKAFLKFSQEDISILLKEFQNFHLNSNNVIEICDWLFDICQRDQLELKKVLLKISDSNFQKWKQKCKELRYPLLQKKKKEFEKILKQINYPSFLKVRTTDYFEDSYLHFEFSLKSQKELKEIIQTLEHNKWKDVFDFIS